jgi:cell division protein ZipA
MELSVREWTIIVGVLLILAVFLDGYRRVRNERSNRIRVSLSKQVLNHHPDPVEEAPSAPNPELPNGGARIIAKQRNQNLHLRESVPVLIEPVQMAAAAPAERVERISAVDNAPAQFDAAAYDEPFHDEPLEYEEPAAIVNEPTPQPTIQKAAQRSEPQLPVDDDFVDEAPVIKKPSRQYAVEQRYIDEMVEEEREHVEPQEVLVVNVLSKDKAGFNGPDLLQILLACDLRFGKMHIFHRYENANGRGAVQFSLANLVEPGTFDLDAIDTFCTPGVSFFMTLPGPQQTITAFNYMIETAQVLVRNLNAELRDDAHSVMTAQTIEHCRQRIRDFERKQLTLQL